MSNVEITGDEAFDSLTGFDEIAIKKFFSVSITALAPTQFGPGDPFQFNRALVFVMERRAGKTDQEAFNAAQGYSLREVNTYFADAEPDLGDDDNPETASGKDGSLPETQPQN